jgi:hypothetical protein
MSEDFIDNAKSWAIMPTPGPKAPGELQKTFDIMSVEELAGHWCALQYIGIKEQTEQTQAWRTYFDHLPHEQPERAFALVVAVLRSEAHVSVLMQLNGKLMPALLHVHGANLVDCMEREARGNGRLCWLLGGATWWVSDPLLKARLDALADKEGWTEDHLAIVTPEVVIDFGALSIPELARVWVEQKSRPDKDHDDNWHALFDRERELISRDPDAMLDLILEILRVESNPSLLSLLAAGPLEDLISMRVIDRVEREAACNAHFRELLDGVWYWDEPAELKTRLNAITGRDW